MTARQSGLRGTVFGLATLLALVSGGAHAETLPATHVKVVGSWGNLSEYKNFEQPFWTKWVTERSGGAVTADITPFNEMGLKGAEIFRLMRQGVIDFGATVLGYVAADDARNEAVDLAGLAPDVATARKISDAYMPVYDKFYKERFGIHVLGIWPYPAQVIFCKDEMKGLADLKGKKVRTGNRTLAEFVGALGGVGVTLPFSEVVPALQNKVVDCAITGSLSGYSAKWYEVTSYVYALPVGWSQVMFAVNEKSWSRLDPKVRTFLEKQIAGLEDQIWKAAGAETQEGFDCLTGAGACKAGQPAHLTYVKVSAADTALLATVLRDTVVPKWAARCPGDCVAEWNRTVGPIVGITAKTN